MYTYDIKPDIYITIERDIDIYDISKVGDKEYLKDIIFMAMNSIHPRVFSLFNKSYIFSKVNDTGSDFINDGSKYPQLKYSNPGVSNGAFSLGIELGFKNIFFFGMDLGYKDLKKHHSKSSLHYNKESRYFKEEAKVSRETKSVNGETMQTDKYLDNVKENIEQLININKNSDLKIYNYSDGAKIENCSNLYDNSFFNDMGDISNKEYSNIISQIDNNFKIYDKDILINYDEIENKFNEVKQLIFSLKGDNLTSYSYLKNSGIFFTQLKILFKEYSYILHLIRGTVVLYMARAYRYSSDVNNIGGVSIFLNKSLDMLTLFIQEVQKDIKILETTIDKPFY